MKKEIILILLFSLKGIGQASCQHLYTQDIDHFWNAYDSIRSTDDSTQQLDYINRLYIGKASDGLKAFLKGKKSPDLKWVHLINNDRLFWDSMRGKTFLVKLELQKLQNHINELQHIYPSFKDATSYFIIGFRQQGGTTRNNLSLIGAEVVMQQPNADALNYICIHEYVHTQQVKTDFRNIDVLTSSIREGACDFIAEHVLKRPPPASYMKYGKMHEELVWSVFKQDMFTRANDWWVSTGENPLLPARDLGYFIGYAICRSYYQSAKNKAVAIKNIIELDYAREAAVRTFLQKSGYEQSLLRQGYDSSKLLPTEGYLLKPQGIEFLFHDPEKAIIIDEQGVYKKYDVQTHGVITAVSVAGDFNNWDYVHSAFQLQRTGTGGFTLKVNKVQLGKPGQKIRFDFVINNKYRVAPGFAVGNREIDDKKEMHLFVRI